MSLIEHPQERAWAVGESATVALMGTINVAVAQLVATIRMLIDTGGWGGHGIQSVEHWVTWKAGVSRRRAGDLARIARRIDELPACWAVFEAGRLTEDAMVRIVRRVPVERDAEVASWAPDMLITQLQRALASYPELPDPKDDVVPPSDARERYLRLSEHPDGWGQGEFCLPPDEFASLKVALAVARDAEFRDCNGLELEAEVISSGSVTWADALMRLAVEGTDALDTTLARTGRRGERTKVVLHHDIDPTGSLGPGQLHLGAVIPDPVARFLSCDAEVLVAAYRAGELIGITPTDRTVSRNLRRVIERRDQGCAHPLCTQTRWLHIHHIVHWAQRGLTIPPNLVCLCPTHHRELHTGDFTITGNPETGTLRFIDARGSPIEPPDLGSPRLPHPSGPSPFSPPLGERLDPRWFGWN
ncbi:MAG: DUF222 domain-containing protein [Acidimicrobiales bacterium]